MKLKLRDRVVLSPNSLYARPNFTQHLSTKLAGVVIKIGTDLEEGWYYVKFKDSNGVERKNSYREGMLIKQ